MKHALLIIVLGLSFVTLSACENAGTHKRVTGQPHVTVDGDGYTVNIGDGRNGEFCPPGHARKGWC